MKDFIKTFCRGCQVVGVSIGATMCFVFQLPLYKSLINLKGFWAVSIFAAMVLLLAGGILIIWLIGCLDE